MNGRTRPPAPRRAHTRIRNFAEVAAHTRIAKRRKQVDVPFHSDFAIAFRRCLHFGGRHPAAFASASEQNHRSPRAESTSVFA
jgi:hypothetical protein